MKHNRAKLRFSIGNKSELLCSSWTLWTAKDPKSDVYLVSRPSSRSMKLSFHESGMCQCSFLEPFVAREQAINNWPNKSRHVDRWKLDANMAPGVTRVFNIVVPPNELRNCNGIDTKNIALLESPTVGMTKEISILFSNIAIPEGDWPAKRSMDTKLIFNYQLPNGKAVWLVQHDFKDLENSQERIRELKHRIKSREPKWSKKDAKIDIGSNRLLVFGINEDKSRYVIDFAADSIFSNE